MRLYYTYSVCLLPFNKCHTREIFGYFINLSEHKSVWITFVLFVMCFFLTSVLQGECFGCLTSLTRVAPYEVCKLRLEPLCFTRPPSCALQTCKYYTLQHLKVQLLFFLGWGVFYSVNFRIFLYLYLCWK